jgi:hypothetical protein
MNICYSITKNLKKILLTLTNIFIYVIIYSYYNIYEYMIRKCVNKEKVSSSLAYRGKEALFEKIMFVSSKK